ncbi:50s ribosomal protein L25 [Candidatus Blochmanniella floridana]|uniref:Large ribosomal subunit protein bL25 n=1 Tax=Blochmanniella floridana TaxID=203907 RepID=RL25_BLOFL|nr:RecName: Full=Large ribosomal subunit protein bL25; AltName: Full=50S ribosomal protein L25 [Candidatus Blochmannia floridanus]CAD83162.1 50s ribosomal protein L25 [Candidatus Blochmannia floridanus]
MLIIKAILRTEIKKSITRKIRKNGGCPAVIYNKNKSPNINVQLSNKDLSHPENVHYFLKNNKVQILINNEFTITAKIQDVQYHPYKSNIIHIDFIHITTQSRS